MREFKLLRKLLHGRFRLIQKQMQVRSRRLHRDRRPAAFSSSPRVLRRSFETHAVACLRKLAA